MGINVSKQKKVGAVTSQDSEPDESETESPILTAAKAASLENIATEYMKQDSYKRSQDKYGIDLQADEFAEDVPVPVRLLITECSNVFPIDLLLSHV
jgi:hypothetical protein